MFYLWVQQGFALSPVSICGNQYVGLVYVHGSIVIFASYVARRLKGFPPGASSVALDLLFSHVV